MRRVRCRRISKGSAEGAALVSSEPISFFGGVDPGTGYVIDRKHELFGRCISDSILVFPTGKGSTVGSYVLYRLAKVGKAPRGIVCREAEPIVAVGAIISGIPMVDRPETSDFSEGRWMRIDGDRGFIEVD
jgi:predicted aconitase with swiveling domain